MKPLGRLTWWKARASFLHWEFRVGVLFGAFLLWGMFLAAGVVLFAVITTWGVDAELEEFWSTAFDGKSAIERFPLTERNRTAEQLEDLALDVGVVFARPVESEQSDQSGQSDLEAEDGKPVDSEDLFQESLKEYFSSLAASKEPVLTEPPRLALEWLSQHQSELERIVTLLIEQESPVERIEVALGFEAPAPNLLAYLQLDRLLLLAAIQAAQVGDEENSALILNASWNLCAPIWERPELIAQLIAHRIVKNQMAVLRRRPLLGVGWSPRLSGLDPPRRMLTAFRMEAWVPWYDESFEELSSQPNWTWRWMMLDHARSMHEMVEEMAARDILTFHPAEFFAEQFARLPRWNIITRFIFPNLYDALPRAYRVAIDLDLTRRLIEGCSDPNGAGVMNRHAEPSIVDGLSWVYLIERGVLTISLDGEIDQYRPENRAELPLIGTVELDRCRSRQL